jgi:hypothetical protein
MKREPQFVLLQRVQLTHQAPEVSPVAGQHQRRRERMNAVAARKAFIARGNASVDSERLCDSAVGGAAFAGHRRFLVARPGWPARQLYALWSAGVSNKIVVNPGIGPDAATIKAFLQ